MISSLVMQILEAHNKVEEKRQIYVPYNILPLDPDSQNQAIMRYPEVCFIICQVNLISIFSFRS